MKVINRLRICVLNVCGCINSTLVYEALRCWEIYLTESSALFSYLNFAGRTDLIDTDNKTKKNLDKVPVVIQSIKHANDPVSEDWSTVAQKKNGQ